jgi:hypothetical protein
MADVADMRIPETFYRYKRTLILLCAALFVWGLAKHSATGVLSVPYIASVLPAWIVPALLWVSALYYAAGFILEVLVAIRLNSELGLRADLPAWQAKLNSYVGGLALDQGDVVTHLRDLAKSTKKTTAFVDNLITEHGTVVVLETPGPTSKTWLNELRRLQEQTEGQEERLNASVENLIEKIGDTRKAMTRLSDAITGQRKLAFWGWEIGGATAAFIAATVIGFSNGAVTSWLDRSFINPPVGAVRAATVPASVSAPPAGQP